MNKLLPAAEYITHRPGCPSIGGNGDADCRCGAVQFLALVEQQSEQLSAAVSKLAEMPPVVTFDDYKRMTVALNLCLAALDRHDGWCGHKRDSPGDSIYRRAVAAAREVLFPNLAPAEPPQQETKVLRAPTTEPDTVADLRADQQTLLMLEAWRGLASWMRAHGTINREDAIDSCARAVENFAEYQFKLFQPSKPVAPAEPQTPEPDGRIYPCRECGVLRSKAEGGNTFTVCDECWDKHAAPVSSSARPESQTVETCDPDARPQEAE